MASIAARLGDHHLCPQHVGGDALPACAPTVLIAGEPAARVGDLMACAGSAPDVIKMGEPTVLIAGREAARFGDATVHLGLIDQGCPTVIIGKTSAEAKRLRLMERLKLIDAARKKAAGMPDGPDKDRLLNAANRLARDNGAVEAARLSQNVYDDAGAPEGFTRITGDALPPALRNATFQSKSGLYSALYRSDIDGSYTLVFRGTQINTAADWIHGNTQNLGFDARQYSEAVNLARQTEAVYGSNLRITGHSLGGGLASAASLASGAPADAFDPAGLHSNTFDRYGLDRSAANGLINTYETDGEILTSAQHASHGLLPSEVGTIHRLNAVDMTTGPDGNPVFTPRTDGTTQPHGLLGHLVSPFTNAKDRLEEAVKRHNVQFIIAGLEQEKTQDIATLKGT
jgi:type VI secretion system secreted protein VgrG